MTIKDIARKVGVSPSSVSLVLNGKASGRVSLLKQQEILRVASAHNFQLDLSARSLRGKSRRLIGVGMPSPQTQFYGLMADHLHRCCADRGYSVIFAFWNSYATTDAAYNSLRRQRVDGIIAWENQHPEAAFPLPTVLYGCQRPDFDCVIHDHATTVNTVFRHLRQLGHRDFGFYGGANDPRCRFLRGLLASDGLSQHPEWFLEHKDNFIHPELDLAAFFDLPRRPTCFFCTSDFFAHALSDMSRAHGLDIPRDLSLVGYNNLPESSWMHPALTTVDVHMETIANTLVDLLFARMRQPERPCTNIKLKTTFIQRQSTASPPS